MTFYIFNSSQPDSNLQHIDEVIFELSDANEGAGSTNITFSYSAFIMQASWPIAPEPVQFVPIRRARSTPILGRTFFQEAYVVADFDRHNMTIMQTRYSTPELPEQLIGMYNSTYMSEADYSRTIATHRNSLKSGTIAGIVIRILVFVVMCASVWWFIRRKRRKASDLAAGSRQRFDDDKFMDLHEVHEAPCEVPVELQQPLPELGPQHWELEGFIPELDSRSTATGSERRNAGSTQPQEPQ